MEKSLPKYLEKEPPEVKEKIEKLIEMAMNKGLKKASDEAKRMPPLIADAFHDALADKVDELKSRGLIK